MNKTDEIAKCFIFYSSFLIPRFCLFFHFSLLIFLSFWAGAPVGDKVLNGEIFCMFVQPFVRTPLWAIQAGLSFRWLASSQASGFRPGWLGLWPGWMVQRGEWMDERPNGQTENLPILQDFIPYWEIRFGPKSKSN